MRTSVCRGKIPKMKALCTSVLLFAVSSYDWTISSDWHTGLVLALFLAQYLAASATSIKYFRRRRAMLIMLLDGHRKVLK